MNLASPRSLFFLAFLACVAMLGTGFYLQYMVGLEPCPLCILQRIFFAGCGLFSLIAALHGRAPRVYSVLILLSALAGAGTAGRQVWLQTLPPDQLPSCLPPLEYMMESMPYADIIWTMFHGSADCAEVSWTLLGLSIPEWSLLAFIGFALFAIVQFFRRRG
ncbi:disulfide bond formation protein B [Pseudomonas nitroreducens]|uniref:Disulfide bond formation protein B n=1 Tax=Pseudomonas nitroreducens TaxID=46680 RepID=A0A246FDK2_PSENT|nr:MULTISPECIES: disulfide bond formation protein B [Pseudomonas]MCG8908625.1 disulfide bond formation protein B [Pseudomonas sp. DP-17]MDU4250362.1 disulfide bond formation protein B [Pseudomonas sp.]OWP52384.1 disulfide bond formation protein B [Pseudomonas nitroreducens]